MSGSRQLGDFLKARRHGLDPAALGIPSTRRRRTPGLRREEIAERLYSESAHALSKGDDANELVAAALSNVADDLVVGMPPTAPETTPE